MDYISSEFTVWRVKAIYGAKVSKFSDDLLKGIPLSKHVGPLLPAKYMWKTGTKEKSVQKDSNKEEKSGGNLVNEQSISNEEQESEKEESTEVSSVDYNDNGSEENDTEVEETAFKANPDTSGSVRAQEESNQETHVRLFV